MSALKKASPEKAAKTAPKPDRFLTDVVDALVKHSGEGTAQLLGSDGLAIKIRGVISTQSMEIDDAIGRGGIPLSRVTIFHGAEGCGKTTVALHLAAECQRNGGIVLYIDKEYKLDPDYARAIGVDVDRMIISQPGTLEDVIGVIEKVINMVRVKREESGKRVPVLVIHDSMDATLTRAELNGEIGDAHVAPKARVLGPSLARIVPLLFKEDIALLIISQMRKKIGQSYGDDSVISGGKALVHWASLVVEFTRIGIVKEGDDRVGQKTKVYIKKNQIAPPFKGCEVEISYGLGVDTLKGVINVAEELGVLKKTGSWYEFEGERIANGIIATKEVLTKDASLAEMIRQKVNEARESKRAAKES